MDAVQNHCNNTAHRSTASLNAYEARRCTAGDVARMMLQCCMAAIQSALLSVVSRRLPSQPTCVCLPSRVVHISMPVYRQAGRQHKRVVGAHRRQGDGEAGTQINQDNQPGQSRQKPQLVTIASTTSVPACEGIGAHQAECCGAQPLAIGGQTSCAASSAECCSSASSAAPRPGQGAGTRCCHSAGMSGWRTTRGAYRVARRQQPE